MELWELVARERVRDSLALYNWSGDALRLSELASAFLPDGTLEIRGREPLHGQAAIISFLSGVSTGADDEGRHSDTEGAQIKRVVRHNVTNVRFLEVTPDKALVACYFTVLTEIGLDQYGRYRDTFVPDGNNWFIQYRFVPTDWRSPSSTMAPPSATG